MADRILRSFLEAYYVLADRLAAHESAPVEQDELVRECLGVGQQYHLQRRIVSGEAISAELFRNGLKLAANRGLLEAGGSEVAEGRAKLARELHEVLRRLEIPPSWDRAHRLRREGLCPATRSRGGTDHDPTIRGMTHGMLYMNGAPAPGCCVATH